MDELLRINNISMKYGNLMVLKNVNMTIHKGDIYGFVGRNGAGKTTLIRVITGLINPCSGSYEFNLPKRLGVMSGIVEAPAIKENLNGYENLKTQAMLLGLKDYEAKIEEILKIVELPNDDKKAGNYSLGMRQRLAIACLLLGNPEFMILDEPANGLDPKGMKEIRELIIRLNKERGITFLISSHILSELDKMATTYGFIENGKIMKEIDAVDLHNVGKVAYAFKVSDTSNIKSDIEKVFNVNCNIVNENYFILDNEIDPIAVCIFLKGRGLEIFSFERKKEELEDYFISLLKGEEEQ
ncbi:MAG: ATP-binding cassette domain-containing protein [Bacilli bacterium]|nr:ATP-binding cassette domain-containing protein [Bacilli bacterium]